MAAEVSLQHFSCHPWKPSEPSCISSAFPTSHVVVKCFFCLPLVIRLLSSWYSVGYSGWFLYNLVVIPDWSWEDVSVASYSSSTLIFFLNNSLGHRFLLFRGIRNSSENLKVAMDPLPRKMHIHAHFCLKCLWYHWGNSMNCQDGP